MIKKKELLIVCSIRQRRARSELNDKNWEEFDNNDEANDYYEDYMAGYD